MRPLRDLPRLVPTLRGPRVTLRPLREADLAIRERWAQDAETHFLISGRELEEEELGVRDWWECHQGNPYTVILAVENERGEYVGDIDLYVENESRGTCGFMIVIGDPEHRGKGYGTEAIRVLLEHAFQELGVRAVLLNVFEFNRQALRCYEKCGFEVFSAVDQAFEQEGRPWRWLALRCTPETFRRARAPSRNGPSGCGR